MLAVIIMQLSSHFFNQLTRGFGATTDRLKNHLTPYFEHLEIAATRNLNNMVVTPIFTAKGQHG